MDQQIHRKDLVNFSFRNMKGLYDPHYFGRSFGISCGQALTQRSIHFFGILVGIEENEYVFFPTGSVYILILFGFGIGFFVLDDQQEGVTLNVGQFKFEPAFGIRFGLALYRTDDFYHGIYWYDVMLVRGDQSRYLCRWDMSELVVDGDGKSDHGSDTGKYDFALGEETNN